MIDERAAEDLMRIALQEARLASEHGDVPIGAVVARRGAADEWVVLGQAHNRRQVDSDPTAHAEILALRQAALALGSWRLEGCALIVTLEPCPMCAGAIVQARVPMVVYGCPDPKAGACHTLYTITNDSRLNHRCTVVSGVLADECAGILSDFFSRKRTRNRPLKLS